MSAKELRFPNVNSTILSGRLTRDPELKHLQNGTAVMNIDLAFNRNFKKNDEWEKVTSYIQVVVWAEKAESAAKYLSKGSPVLVEGSLEMETYQNKDNQTIYKMKLVAFKINNLERESRDSDYFENIDKEDQL